MRHEDGVILRWYDIGVELMEEKNTVALDEIRSNHSNDVSRCCTEMLKKWLRYDPDADWDKLARALYKIGLRTAAENIRSEIND